MDISQTPVDASLPLARVIPIAELLGRLNKYLLVPPGRRGVVLTGSGRSHVYPPGKYLILSFWQRFNGWGVGLKAGYVPSIPFRGMVETYYLLSGDGKLLDASLLASVEVSDSVRYFTEQVLPSGEVREAVIDIGLGRARTVLAALVRCYTAADLVAGLPARRLAEELRSGLTGALGDQGLKLGDLEIISFWPSDERVKVAEKIQAIEGRLEDLAQEQKMKSAESRLSEEDFNRQIRAELGEGVSVQTLPPQSQPAVEISRAEDYKVAEEGKKARTTLLDNLKSWIKVEKREGVERKHWALFDLFRRKTGGDSVPTLHRPTRRWWLPGVLWIAFLLLIGYVLTRIGLGFGTITKISSGAIYGFITGLWLVILPLLFEAVKKLVEKREQISEDTWMLPGSTRLDILTRSDRPRTDQLVREQCSNELNRAADIFDTLVTSLYQQEQTLQALTFRTTKNRFSEAAGKVKSPNFGAPPYLTDLNISTHAWDHMLDYDEDLLMNANALSEKARSFQQGMMGNGQSSYEIAEIDRCLEDFIYRFSGRSLALRYQKEP